MFNLIYKNVLLSKFIHIHFLLQIIFIYLNGKINEIISVIKPKRKRVSALTKSSLSDYPTDLIAILIGGLLGDFNARIGKNNNTNNGKDLGVTFTIAQSDIHKDYIDWLHEIFYNYELCSNRIPKKETIKNTSKRARSEFSYKYVLYTSKRVAFKDIFFAFYKKDLITNRYKRGIYNIDFIQEWITPFSLAIWVMDDGTNLNGNIKFCTDSFSLNEVQILQNILLTKFNIETNLHNAGNGKPDQYRIYVTAKGMTKLIPLIEGYIIPSFKYKLGPKYTKKYNM
uniref:Homing endonuclease LAGLIDADG domain-containing protein n=1 Tax=Cyberlindnera suaveolens TaxID=907738 RepID=S5U5Q4_9ASCO|nr:hypothetical protein H731WILSUA-L_006 [Cyberlindnera suaveolens]AGS44436.1 hypothetical protein H731WILSUA-L_006 [Cyberlindnera suaveolens]